MVKKITIISGDGIGKEVMEAGIIVLESLDLNFDFIVADAGFECFQNSGTTISEETINLAKNSQATLFGAITSTPGEKSPIITLRKELDVFANLRPIKTFEGVDSLFHDIDFLIVRENTEDLYLQREVIEHEKFDENMGNIDEGFEATKAKAIRVITKEASENICYFAFKKAIADSRKRVTCVHKANVLKKTDGMFKEAFYKVAKNYSKSNPEIVTNDYYVNAMAMYLLTKPQEFDVVVTSNLYGDILSDEGAGLVGGLGLIPSANIGDKNGLFEPIHGSGLDIAGLGIANPIAMILSISMMLDFLKEGYYGEQIRLAVENVLKVKRIVTPDLGGKSRTMDLTNAIKNELKNLI
jgi:methanogen homoisocitrate dehydrogenase